jgi:hypothetical protein
MTLPKLNKENSIIALIILMIGGWIALKLFAPEVENTTTIEETVKVDTSYNKVDTSFFERATPKKPIKPKKVKAKVPEKDPEPEKYDSVRNYVGTYHFDYGKFDWSIDTGGILAGYTFTPSFTIPTVTTEKVKTITQTRTIIQRGVFAGGGMNSQGNFHAGATYLGNKFMIEYNFSPAAGIQNQPITVNVHQVGFKYKIF